MDMITMELLQHEHVNDNESKRGPKEREKRNKFWKSFNLQKLVPSLQHFFIYSQMD